MSPIGEILSLIWGNTVSTILGDTSKRIQPNLLLLLHCTETYVGIFPRVQLPFMLASLSAVVCSM